jgi:hypothetical protein
MEVAMEKTEVSRNQIVNELLHIGHGDLSIYNDVGLKAVQVEPELFAHLIAWNHKKGEVRDSKAALPAIALRGAPDKELYESAVAHLCLLDPRTLLKALVYSKCELSQIGDGGKKMLRKGVSLYLRKREESRGWWNKTAVQHRKSLKSLYKIFHTKPAPSAQNILFGKPTGKMIKGKDGKLKPEIGPIVYPKGSVFEAIKRLKDMAPDEAAGTILNYKVPFLVAVGALGGIKDKPDVILALVERMSGSELITNTNMLQKCGVFDNPALKAAYDKALDRMKKDPKVSTLKASRAGEVVKDKKAGKKLKQIQEDRLHQLGGIEGDWLVLGDKSVSMRNSIKVAKKVAGLIAQQVKGNVHLIFFDTMPTYFNVAGKSLDEINEITKRISAGGNTSIGCGLDFLYQKGKTINGIAICSDGGDNTNPYFYQAYQKYVQKFGIEPPVYHFWVSGDPNQLAHDCQQANILLEHFDLDRDVDFYSLPNIIKTLRTSRYMLVEEIMETALLTFKDVFKEVAL